MTSTEPTIHLLHKRSLQERPGLTAYVLAPLTEPLLVATNDFALVFEVKGFTRPIRGGENGDWQYQQVSGQWKDIRNPYRQALGAAFEVL